MAVYVRKTGVHKDTARNTTWNNAGFNVNFDCPTNPSITNTASAANKYICAEIRNDASTATTMVKETTGAYNSYSENLAKTPGYRVKTYFNETQTGQQYNSINLLTHDYFILLFADDNKQHHFAKITAEVTDDVEGDALEFTPKLGSEIPKGTKFIVFKGPTITDTSVVAVSAGALVTSSDSTHLTNFIVTNPLWFFYNDRLNKKNELDHNTKYRLCYNYSTDNSAIALSDKYSVFVTVQDAHSKIIDKSKFTLSTTLIDNKRKMDNPATSSSASYYYDDKNQFSAVTSFTDYTTNFPNIRRDTDDSNGTAGRVGPLTYLHYEESPKVLNKVMDMFSSRVFSSMKDKASFAESRVVDGNRTFTSKNVLNDKYVLKEKIAESGLTDWFETKLTLDSITSGSTNLKFKTDGNYDARTLWGQHEEVKIGDYIGFISTVSAASSGLHTVVCQSYWRLETESTFTNRGSAPFSAEDKIYRRMWSPKTRTLMATLDLDTDVTYTGLSALTSHPLDIDTLTYKINNITLGSYTESRYNNAIVTLVGPNYAEKEIRISFGDKTHQFYRLEPERTHYRPVANSKTSIDYNYGKFTVDLEIFDGKIEEIVEDIEMGQPVVEVAGRNIFSKLIGPTINKNTLFTSDLIHSSMSPLSNASAGKTGGGANATFYANLALGDISVVFNTPIAGLNVGDTLYNVNGDFIGIVSSQPDQPNIIIEFGACATASSSEQIFVGSSNKHYTFKKALSASAVNSNTVSSLEGASDKGIYFTSGVSVSSRTTATPPVYTKTGNKEFFLGGTSENTNAEAVGYNFDSVGNIKNDRAFQAKLKDDVSGNYFSYDVVNGLSDFVVLNSKGEDGDTTITLAPRIGLYLGRVDRNDTDANQEFVLTSSSPDVYESDLMKLTDTTMNVQATSLSGGITTSSAVINTHFKRGDPVFAEDSGVFTFQGYFIRAEAGSGSSGSHYSYNEIRLDRDSTASNGNNIYKLSQKNTTDMYFINRPASLLQLASPYISNTKGLLPFNINIHDNSDSTITTNYIKRYGSPYYKFVDLEEGNYSAIDEFPIESLTQIKLDGSTASTVNDNSDARGYYDVLSQTNYYAMAHRFQPSYTSSTPTITQTHRDDSSFSTVRESQGFYERRGNKPSRGTNFFDYYLTGNTATVRARYPIAGLPHVMNGNIGRTWERTLRQMDSKVSRHFLFTTSDLLPESDLRKTSLYYGSRDLTDFSIMLKNKGNPSSISNPHTTYLGGGSSISDTDDNNPIMSISTAPAINSLKKFSMLRLVEMTLDWHFNSVDAENLPSKNKTLQLDVINRMANLFPIQDASGNNLTVGSYDTSNNRLSLSAAPDYVSGTTNEKSKLHQSKNYLFFTAKGNYIGYGAAQAWAQIIEFSAQYGLTGPHVNDDCALTVGQPVFAFCIDTDSYEDLYVRGHNSKDTFTSMPMDGAIHMVKGAVMNNEAGRTGTMDGYAEDNDDSYHELYLPDNAGDDHYSLIDNLASEKRTASIALPPTFSVLETSRTVLSGVRIAKRGIDTHQVVSSSNSRPAIIISSSDLDELDVQDHSGESSGEQRNFKTALTDYGPIGANALRGVRISLLETHSGSDYTNYVTTGVDSFSWTGTYYSIKGRDANKLIAYDTATFQYATPSAGNYVGYRLRNEPYSGDYDYCLLVDAATSALTNDLQYHIWLSSGQYLGKTAANQTYGQDYLIMEYCYYDIKFNDYSDANRLLKYSLVLDESLVHTEGNMQISEVIKSINNKEGHLKHLYADTLAVFLDRFDIEDGGQSNISAGVVSSEIENAVPLLQSMGGTATAPHKVMLETKSNQGFGFYKSEGKESSDGSSPYIADGAYMLFKPHLKFVNKSGSNCYSASQTVVGVGSTNTKLYEFTVRDIDGADNPTEKNNAWLNYAPNLTGCYLVSHHGKQYGLNKHGFYAFPTSPVSASTTTEAYYTSDATGAASINKTLKGLHETIPSYIHYVVSHTIKRTADCTKHQIVIDNAGTIGKVYKVMRTAENTFYDFSPKKIKINTLTPEYTKKAYENSCYEPTKSFKLHNARHEQFTGEVRYGDPTNIGSRLYSETGFGEGVSSMYIIADPSNKGSGNHLVYRTPSDCFGSSKLLEHSDTLSVGITDGINNILSQMQVSYISDLNVHEFEFSNLRHMVGAVSIGETFDITVSKEIKGNYTDATIGCGVNICFEADDLLNDLFDDEGLEFEKQDITEYPVFLSPEYKGVSLLTASNYILDKKNRRLLHDKKFLLRDADSSLNKPKVFIFEMDDTYSVKHLTKERKLFDQYNEVIIYGRNLKAHRKNVRNIKETGNRRTLEITDESIYTQKDADARASKLLSIHNEVGELVDIEVRGKDIFTLRPADEIEISFPSQNIRRNTYLIIEIEHYLDGFSKLKLGNTAKNLAERFTELLLAGVQMSGLTRPREFKEPSKSLDYFEDMKVKEIRIKIRKRLATGGATLGFGSVLNTSTTPMGFTGGESVVYTDLVEEEL